MFTSIELTLSLVLAVLIGAAFGALVTSGSCRRRQRRNDMNTEKAAMWRIDDRAYRLVRSPGLEEKVQQTA